MLFQNSNKYTKGKGARALAKASEFDAHITAARELYTFMIYLLQQENIVYPRDPPFDTTFNTNRYCQWCLINVNIKKKSDALSVVTKVLVNKFSV